MMKLAKKKLQKYYNLTSEVYTVATVLDPALKLAYHKKTSGPDHMDADQVLQSVRAMKAKYSGTSQSASQPPAQSQAETSSSIWGEIVNEIEGEELEAGRDELDAYVNSPRASADADMLQWWAMNESKFPVLAAMARNYLAVPATSAPSERAFSLGRQVVSTFRHQLETDTIQHTMCLKAWMKQVE